MSDSNQVIVSEVALSFARALVSGEFEAARGAFSETLKQEWSAARLEEALNSLIEYGDGPPQKVELTGFDDMNSWPKREVDDLGWAYVAICGDGFNEAVSVVVAADGEKQQEAVIREVEWGRP